MKKTKLIALLLALSLVSGLSAIVYAASSGYDSASDPLVTKSYVDQKFLNLDSTVKESIKTSITEELQSQLDNLDIVNDIKGDVKDAIYSELYEQIKDELLKEIGSSTVNADLSYELVSLTKGQTLISCGALELTLRQGSATAITVDDGLSDLSAGKDLTSGEALVPDHYIVNPIGDGRGILITSDTAYVLVRGEYEIK